MTTDDTGQGGDEPDAGGDRLHPASAAFEAEYQRLREQARVYMRKQPPGHTLQPTALVNEIYCKLFDAKQWTSRDHFLATAGRAMMNVLVDHARGKQRAKRKAAGERVPLDGLLVHFQAQQVDVIDLKDKLDELAARGPGGARAADIVQLRAFSGLTMARIAKLLGTPERTISRDWQFAKAWLHRELGLAPARS